MYFVPCPGLLSYSVGVSASECTKSFKVPHHAVMLLDVASHYQRLNVVLWDTVLFVVLWDTVFKHQVYAYMHGYIYSHLVFLTL